MKMIFDSKALWKERFSAYTTEVMRYLRYMFNDHLLFVLVIGLGAGIFYYAGWVKTLEPTFPVIPLMVILLTASIAISPVATLLQKPDVVYLIVQEKAMNHYFAQAKIASFFMQFYVFLIVLGACMPMYVEVTGVSYSRFFSLFIVLALLKAWNIYFGFESMKLEEADTTWMFVRVIVNALLIYIALISAPYISIPVTIILLFASYFWMTKKVAKVTLRWEYLVDKEEARMNRFYRLVNLFTDVPHLRGTVRRRSYLDFLYQPIPYAKRKTFAYLFSRTFIRTNEYSGLYIRLTIIAVILLVFVQGFYLNIVFSLLFLYLTGFQFIPMLKHYDSQIMLRLYPIDDGYRHRSFIHFLRILLLAQALLFSTIGIAQNGTINGLIILSINLAFVVIFTFIYAPVRMRKMYE
ncbi:ABC transporter permease [Listeria sp. FSL L7-1485]|uniref:ABC transporter permease n=1 Tax=Listeria immobilis TaxID=2713502 RepID=A0A7X0X7N2_9LIST|nr:ABC transporter permease [Listeria immobilis]MBC1483117.1 ABC transporter permease [Listeria immobilis]MBC1489059.1 ABC transporter permease [Listeria immobilis]MBC1507083.1 ABC transporter permease [Listeria immobilis]MBC1509557.1 ABC transporter permease [Listeria immobilis]MBC1536124.1 ABC transporter permease [Listeria immobilis]